MRPAPFQRALGRVREKDGEPSPGAYVHDSVIRCNRKNVGCDGWSCLPLRHSKTISRRVGQSACVGLPCELYGMAKQRR